MGYMSDRCNQRDVCILGLSVKGLLQLLWREAPVNAALLVHAQVGVLSALKVGISNAVGLLDRLAEGASHETQLLLQPETASDKISYRRLK